MPLAVSPYARASRRRTWRFLPPGRGGPGDFKREQGFWWKRQARRIKRQRFEAISKSNERRLAILRVPADERERVY